MSAHKSSVSGKTKMLLAGAFFLTVLFFIMLSLLGKAIVLYQESSFEGKYSYNLAVIHSKNSLVVYSFSPDTKSITVLTVLGKRNTQSLNTQLGVFIDGQVAYPQSFVPRDVSSLLESLLFSLPTRNASHVTILDVFRLYMFSKSVPKETMLEKQITTPLTDAKTLPLFPSIFTDSIFYKEGRNIAIINASNTPGMGARLARLLTNMGGNVISVTTANESVSTSRIITRLSPNDYSIKRLVHIVGFPLRILLEKQGAPDIQIIIGTNGAETKNF